MASLVCPRCGFMHEERADGACPSCGTQPSPPNEPKPPLDASRTSGSMTWLACDVLAVNMIVVLGLWWTGHGETSAARLIEEIGIEALLLAGVLSGTVARFSRAAEHVILTAIGTAAGTLVLGLLGWIMDVHFVGTDDARIRFAALEILFVGSIVMLVSPKKPVVAAGVAGLLVYVGAQVATALT